MLFYKFFIITIIFLFQSPTIIDRPADELGSWERVCWDLASLTKLKDEVKGVKKTKQSAIYSLQETLETLHEELSKREGSLLKEAVKGKLAVVTEYYK